MVNDVKMVLYFDCLNVNLNLVKKSLTFIIHSRYVI
jgi:hypothetical protein